MSHVDAKCEIRVKESEARTNAVISKPTEDVKKVEQSVAASSAVSVASFQSTECGQLSNHGRSFTQQICVFEWVWEWFH